MKNIGKEKEKYLLFINLYRIKFIIIYFIDQHRQVSNRVGSFLGKLFANYRLVRLVQNTLSDSIDNVNYYMNRINKNEII